MKCTAGAEATGIVFKVGLVGVENLGPHWDVTDMLAMESSWNLKCHFSHPVNNHFVTASANIFRAYLLQ